MNKDDQFEGIIKEVNQILRRGTIRGKQKYNFKTCYAINCLGHSIFNFKNADVESLINKHEKDLYHLLWDFERFAQFKYEVHPIILCKKTEEDFLEKVKLSGLEIRRGVLREKNEEGQYNVAFYFCFTPGQEGFHFMRQEEDGTWSSKMGTSIHVEFFKKLPRNYYDYKLVRVYKITNPFLNRDANWEEE